MMKFEWFLWSIFILWLSCCTNGHLRGPHHPKGPPLEHDPYHQHHHHHYVPQRQSSENDDGRPPQVLTHDKNLLHDKEHMKEDIGEWIFEDGKNPTAEEMEFHYFKMHDFDNNSKLDGLEILQAISHVLPMDDEVEVNFVSKGDRLSSRYPNLKQNEEDFNYYVGLIDKVLEKDDVDNDGYLSYPEYVLGRLRGEAEDGELKKT